MKILIDRLHTKIAIATCCFGLGFSLISCNTTPSPSISSPGSPTPTKQVISAPQTELVGELEPEVGTIKRMEQGDLMCYVTFTDASGVERDIAATFELCDQRDRYLNQYVRIIYGVGNVNDCQSNEPCGKTRRINLANTMQLIDREGQAISSTSNPGDSLTNTTIPTPKKQVESAPTNDSVKLSNKDWTVTVGNRNSWSGKNGTGNLTYRGCNINQECLNLTGGVITCRDGLCSTIWRNNDYSYTLTSPITAENTNSQSTLIVRQNDKVLQRITGLE